MANANKVFIGRTNEIRQIDTFIKENLQSKGAKIIRILGSGGIGKSRLLYKMQELLSEAGYITTKVFDFSIAKYRSYSSLALAILCEIDPNAARLIENKYFNSNYQESDLIPSITQSFNTEIINALNEAGKNRSISLFFDSYEAIANTKLEDWLDNFLYDISISCFVLLAGRRTGYFGVNEHLNIRLSPFTLRETQLLLNDMLKSDSPLTLCEDDHKKLLQQCQGKPMLIASALEELFHEESKQLLDMQVTSFRQRLLLKYRTLPDDYCRSILVMYALNRKINCDILSVALKIQPDKAQSLISTIQNYAFVKQNPSLDSLTLHDEMRNMMGEYLNISRTYTNSVQKYIVENYYNIKIEDIKSQIVLCGEYFDALYYIFQYDRDTAMEKYHKYFNIALDMGRYDLCDMILDEVSHYILEPDEKNLVSMLQAELSIVQQENENAFEILKTIEKSFLNSPTNDIRVNECLGDYFVSPYSKKRDINKAIELFVYCINLCVDNEIKERLPYIYHALAKSYAQLLNSSKANIYYNIALDLADSCNLILYSATILDDLARVHIANEEYQLANEINNESIEIRQKYAPSTLCYNMLIKAEIEQRTGQYEAAIQDYMRAESLLIDNNDYYYLYKHYVGVARTYILLKRYDMSKKYTSLAWSILSKYGFTAEYSDYYLLKFELTFETENKSIAFKYLRKALHYAEKYQNAHARLACLHYSALLALQEKTFIEYRIVCKEIEKCKAMGCEFHFHSYLSTHPLEVNSNKSLFDIIEAEFPDQHFPFKNSQLLLIDFNRQLQKTHPYESTWAFIHDEHT